MPADLYFTNNEDVKFILAEIPREPKPSCQCGSIQQLLQSFALGTRTNERLHQSHFLNLSHRLPRSSVTTVFADEAASGRMDWLLAHWVVELEAAEAKLREHASNLVAC
jgi:hypothetical protein